MRIIQLGIGTVLSFALVGLAACSSGDDGAPTPFEEPGPTDATTNDAAHGDSAPGTPDTGGGGDDTSTGDDDAGRDAGSDATSAGDAGHDAGHDTGADASSASDAGDGASDDGGSDDAGDAAIDAAIPDASIDVDAAPGDAGPLPTPIGQWTFEVDGGTTAPDVSGNGHAATLKGGASWSAAGKSGGGLALDGVDGYADVGVALLDTTHSFTVSCWISLAAVNAWESAISQDVVNGSLFGLKLRGDGSNQFDFDVETSDVMSPGFAVAQSKSLGQASTWTHLAGVYDASGTGALVLYVNGAPEATTAVGGALGAATGHFVIGRGLYNGAAGSYVHGVIDDVEVRDVALSAPQIAALYAATK